MTKIVEIISELKRYLDLPTTISRYRVLSQDFSRKSKLSFSSVALLGIQLMKSSLSVELHTILQLNGLESVSKSAYSQARYKIEDDFYSAWNKVLINALYAADYSQDMTNSLSNKRLKGYYVEAMDGSKLSLPNLKGIKSHFGFQVGGSKTQKTQTAMCLLLTRYDVMNHYILQSEVSPMSVGELSVAKSWVKDLNNAAITVFDRGFASLFLCYVLQKYEKPFVIRVKLGFNQLVKDFVASPATDSIVKWEAPEKESFGDEHMEKGAAIQVRLVKIILPNGDLEVLITSLVDQQEFTLADLNILYQMRWGIETAYDRLKNQLLIMTFSGLKVEAIYQDIHATIFVHNLQQMLCNDAQVIVNQQSTDCVYEYAVNNSVATGLLKNKIMTLFLTQEPEVILKELINLFAKHKEPIRPHRKANRRIKSIAKRRNLITQTNFKRCW